jgi:hypothetical protein
MNTHYAVRDRDGAVHDETGRKREALRARKAYGGMVVQAKGESDWKPYKRRKIFLWFFLALQAVFIIWLIVGTASTGSGINASVVAQCHSQAVGMGMSQAQCVSFLGGAAKTGTALGATAIAVVWVIVDFVVGLTYGIYRLARRT